MIRFLGCCFLLFWSLTTLGQISYSYEQISVFQGLSQTSVGSVLRDKIGLLWIGTREGLNRYDGSQMKTYFHDPEDPESLPGDFIHFVTQDLEGQIWVGTNEGLARYLPRKDAFERVNPQPEGNAGIYSNYLSLGSRIVFGAGDHFAIYNIQSRQFSRIRFKGERKGLPLMYKILPWHGESVLIASRWHGLFVCDLNTGQIKKAGFCQEREIMDACFDSYRNLWLGTYSNGVLKYNWKGKQLAHYVEDDSGNRLNSVLSIQEVNEKIWFGTDGGGVMTLSPENEEIEHVETVPYDRSLNQLNTVSTIYEDEFSNVWIGTLKGGLFGLKLSSIFFHSESIPNSNYGMSNPTMLSLVEDHEGIIWFGTDGGGLNAFDPETSQFTHYPGSFKKKVNAITPIDKSRFLLNYYSVGLVIFDKKSSSFSSVKPDFDGNGNLPGKGKIGVGLYRHSSRKVFIFENGIYAYYPLENRIKELTLPGMGSAEGELKKGGEIDSERWIIYGNEHLYIFHTLSESLEVLVSKNDLDGGNILSACVDFDKEIWIGTTDGLFQKKLEGEIQKFESGLFRRVTSLVADKKGRIWFGAGGSLFSYYKPDSVFKNYGLSDGVSPNEYLPKATLRSRKGDVYLGGVAGFVRIDHEYQIVAREPSFPRIISILIDGHLADEKDYENFQKAGEIVLPNSFKSFKIRFFVNSSDFFNKKYIRYSIDGFSENAVETSDMNLDLSNLPSGNYSLKVTSKASDGSWGEMRELMVIRVLPPWWLSWWFLMILGVFTFGLLFLVRYSIYRRAHNKMQIEIAQKENQLNEQRVKFLVNISHELRTPVSLVYGPLERLLQGRVNSDAERTDLLQLMFRHVNYVRELIDQLLEFRQIEESSVKLKLQKIHLNKWLKETVDGFGENFKEINASLIFRLDEKITYVPFDQDKIRKVIYNLLINVIKHAPTTSIIEIITEAVEENKVRISIADDGPGIPEEALSKVFERFYMVNQKQGGTGIGLAFSRMLIELHGGTLQVRNRESHGAVFYFDLPLNAKISAEMSCAEPLQSGKAEKSFEVNDTTGDENDDEIIRDLGEMVILLVEDDPELLKFLKGSLNDYFKKVLTAKNGKEALIVIRDHNPDLVVSDVMMPEMDGWELCKSIKSDIDISHIPVVLLTARNNENDSVKGYKLGADQYLGKPVRFDLLLSVIRNLIVNRQQIKKKYKEGRSLSGMDDLTFSNADEEFMRRLNAILEEEMSNPELDVELLVDKLAMSRATLYSKTKAILGIGVNTYINNCRIKYACTLLKESDWPIGDVAFKTGFSAQGYFSTLFKQITGTTPKKYRQEHKK
ncbi:hybrid sensor histidine kinase/response regulator transcription factor [Marinilabilia rubra]|uniref:histidine kinase n=1 Tax=Marinilabilia rubra TaxID=2162893 RepID=A0A2U2BBD8_9BACT|nr:ATP-binding protein [Marinilabilia rubra]PWE00376.1 hypothetical protein DDZ16_05400 [Marinilabilia rubra]